MGSFINPHTGGGSIPQIWQPYWGIDICSYVTSETCAFLIKDCGVFSANISIPDGIIGAVKIYGVDGTLLNESTFTTSTTFVFDYSTYTTPFVTDYGYGVYLVVVSSESIINNISIVSGYYNSLLYACIDITGIFTVNNSQPCNPVFEGLYIKNGLASTQALRNNRSLRYVEGALNNTSHDAIAYDCYSLVQWKDFGSKMVNATASNLFGNNYSLKDAGFNGITNNVVTTMANAFYNCYAYSTPIKITSTSLINFSSTDMRSLPELYIDAPLSANLVIYDMFSVKKITVKNTNWKTKLTTTNTVDIRYAYSISAVEITAFLNELEDLSGYTAQNILKTGVTNWNAEHTAAANAKNWNVI